MSIYDHVDSLVFVAAICTLIPPVRRWMFRHSDRWAAFYVVAALVSLCEMARVMFNGGWPIGAFGTFGVSVCVAVLCYRRWSLEQAQRTKAG